MVAGVCDDAHVRCMTSQILVCDVVCSSVNERAMVRYFLRLWWWFYFVDIRRQPEEVRLAVYRTVQYNSLRRLVTQLDTVLIVYSFYFPCLTPSTINSYLLPFTFLRFPSGPHFRGPLIIKFAGATTSISQCQCVHTGTVTFCRTVTFSDQIYQGQAPTLVN